MPFILIAIGCFFLIFSFFLLKVPFLSAIDLASVEWFSHKRILKLNEISIVLSFIGSLPFVLFITAIWCFYAKLLKKYKKLTFICVGLFGSTTLAWMLKFIISRSRPPEVYHLVDVFGSSFPSAHSVYAAAIGCMTIYIYRQSPNYRIIFLCSILWIIGMGISRIYLGVHYPSDVLAGWGTSLVYISITYLLFIKLSRTRSL